MFTVYMADSGDVLEPRLPVGAGSQRRKVVVAEVNNKHQWQWRVKDHDIEWYGGW